MEAKFGKRCMATGIESRTTTYHHITKKEDGGKNTLYNGSLLCRLVHDYIHRVENKDKELYYLMSECLGLYRQCLEQHNEELTRQYEEEVMHEYVKEIGGMRK